MGQGKEDEVNKMLEECAKEGKIGLYFKTIT